METQSTNSSTPAEGLTSGEKTQFINESTPTKDLVQEGKTQPTPAEDLTQESKTQFINEFTLTNDLAKEYVKKVLVQKPILLGWILAISGGVGAFLTSFPSRYFFLFCIFAGVFIARMTPYVSLRQIRKNAGEEAREDQGIENHRTAFVKPGDQEIEDFRGDQSIENPRTVFVKPGDQGIEDFRTVFSDQITVQEGAHQQILSYAMIRKVRETKNLIVLQLQGHAGILIKKDAFSQGNLEDFRRFIKKMAGGN